MGKEIHPYGFALDHVPALAPMNGMLVAFIGKDCPMWPGGGRYHGRVSTTAGMVAKSSILMIMERWRRLHYA